MCLACWDADKMEEKKKMGMKCDGRDMLVMSTEELKSTLHNEWLQTHKNSYRVYHSAISDNHDASLTWKATNPETREEATISVKFI